jgi:ribosome-associated protein
MAGKMSFMSPEELRDLAFEAIDSLKGKEIVVLDVRKMTSMTDYMVIASGTSNRHVKSMADNVVMEVKKRGELPLGVEGETAGDWILVDLGPVLVHIQMPETRAFYELEKLWGHAPSVG